MVKVAEYWFEIPMFLIERVIGLRSFLVLSPSLIIVSIPLLTDLLQSTYNDG